MNKLVPAFQLLGIGFYVAVCIAGGILLGSWLGGKRPVFIIVGLVIGLGIAFFGVYRMVKPIISNYNKKSDKGNG
jgi:ATP synthase protein I